MLVQINRPNFERYWIKFWTERKLVKGGVNPGIEPTHRKTSARGRNQNMSSMVNKQGEIAGNHRLIN